MLLREEGSGILNWAIDGACELLKNGGQMPRSEEQTKRIEELLKESESVPAFVETQVDKYPMGKVTMDQLYSAYLRFCAM